jgi:uncharacterized membrane protein YhaH (DUF805 family)
VVGLVRGGIVVAALRAERKNGDDMNFTDWYVSRGRITRRTLWLHYMLVFLGLTVLAAVADAAMGYPGYATPEQPSGLYDWVGGPVSLFVALFTLVPSISSTVTRLHDRGHSAWWLLWMLLPLFGWIVLLVQTCFLRGDAGPNQYGPAPDRPVQDPVGV